MDEEDVEAVTPIESQMLLQEQRRGNRNSFDETDMVMVLDNDELVMENRNSSDLQSPLRSVTDVLREAENIITDGPLQQTTTLDNQNVIVDEIDVEFPNANPTDGRPFEIIVRHSKVIEQPANQQRDDSMYITRQFRLPTLLEGLFL
uniref:Uncharacterized protein n=1 Tax=Caenorhabditis japonica TaxID=281687 RepID=A0A8R1DQ85_CAEJA